MTSEITIPAIWVTNGVLMFVGGLIGMFGLVYAFSEFSEGIEKAFGIVLLFIVFLFLVYLLVINGVVNVKVVI